MKQIMYSALNRALTLTRCKNVPEISMDTVD